MFECGTPIKVLFFSITNINGSIHAKFDVLSPKKVLYKGKVVDLTKLNEYSKSLENGMFVGVEQTKKDSLFTAKGANRMWSNGHIGYFKVFDTLIVDDKIREILGVDDNWDGEWTEDEVLDKLTEQQIQQKITTIKKDLSESTKICSRCNTKIPNSTKDSLCEDCRNVQQLNKIFAKAGMGPVIETTTEDFEETIKSLTNESEKTKSNESKGDIVGQ